MDDHVRCRLEVSGGELELSGSPSALRALARLLRDAPSPSELRIGNGLVVQVRGGEVLTVTLRAGLALHLSGDDAHLDIVWSALQV